MSIALSRPSKGAPKRMQPLAKLPVFFDLQGKRAVLAGGSALAAWKAELLVAAGALVEVYAPRESLCEEMSALFGGRFDQGKIRHHDCLWTEGCFKGAALAIADAPNERDAKQFYDAAINTGVPVNIIDKPEFSQFQVGSIVNRSPVVIGISTDGAAPILGQAIRRRIETLLPASLSDWAAVAKSLRACVSARFAFGPQRRAFWEHVSTLAFGPMPASFEENKFFEKTVRMASQVNEKEGRVTLVGAGPGDAELLTLKAVRALQAADVILFDDLVSDDVLDLARREAKRMLVGKRGGRASCRQEDINDMMVSLAKAGKRVVRLKSGDPMIFGRAGEEIARLKAENISVDVVPGITAAMGLASALGVSLTHRDHAQSVRFVTGHSRKGELPTDIDWRAVADPATSTLFYMGGRTAGKIATRLLAEGMAPDMPIVIASSVSRENERHWRGTLGTLVQGIAEIGYDQPVLIAVGHVFAIAKDVALQKSA